MSKKQIQTDVNAPANQQFVTNLIDSPANSGTFKNALNHANINTLLEALTAVEGKDGTKGKCKTLNLRLKKLGYQAAEEPEPEAKPEPEPIPESTPEPEQTERSEAGFKFSCLTSQLLEHLAVYYRLLPDSGPHAILRHVLIQADRKKSQVLVLGYNLKTAYQATIDADVEAEGTFTLPAKLFYDLVTRLPEEPITLSHDIETGIVSVECSSGLHRIRGIDADEFPAIPSVNGETFGIVSDRLKKTLDSTLFSASTDETKQVLCGVHLTLGLRKELGALDPLKNHLIEAAATDGHRLAVYRDRLPTVAANEQRVEFTLSSGAASELSRVLDKAGEIIAVRLGGEEEVVDSLLTYSHIRFETVKSVYVFRLIDGQYPDYLRLIPSKFLRTAIIPREAMIFPLERVALFTKNENVVKFSISEEEMLMNAHGDSGVGDETIPIQLNGEAIEIAFNASYVLASLKNIGTPEIEWQMNTSTSPAVFRPHRKETSAPEAGERWFISLVMPVQIRSN